MKFLLICAIFCVSLRISTLQPILEGENGNDTDSDPFKDDKPVNETIKQFFCSSGYVLHGKLCYSVVPATEVKKLQVDVPSCPTGFYYNGVSCVPYQQTCPVGYQLIGGICQYVNTFFHG